jgi:hypothetical protein
MTKNTGKLSVTLLFSFIFISLLNSSLISAGMCKNDRGDYYYCEKYSRYNECDLNSKFYSDYKCKYSSTIYYNYDNYRNYYDTSDVYYEYNYTLCTDYHYFKDVYDYDVYRHYCMTQGIYNSYRDKYGNLVKVIRPDYRSVVYYDYTDNPLYPDYYKSQVEQQNIQNEKLKPLVIYVN